MELDPGPGLPGGYALSEVDRGIGLQARCFVRLDGEGPIGAALTRARQQQRVSLLDAGCGTGRALADLVGQLEMRVPGVPIMATGISVDDLSSASEEAWVRNLIRCGRIRYRVGALEDPAVTGPATHDVVLCHEVLVHSHRPARLLRSIAATVARGGALFLNAHAEQHQTLRRDLLLLARQGWNVRSTIQTHRSCDGDLDCRLYVRLDRPAGAR